MVKFKTVLVKKRVHVMFGPLLVHPAKRTIAGGALCRTPTGVNSERHGRLAPLIPSPNWAGQFVFFPIFFFFSSYFFFLFFFNFFHFLFYYTFYVSRRKKFKL
jgi:hypothetical protein